MAEFDPTAPGKGRRDFIRTSLAAVGKDTDMARVDQALRDAFEETFGATAISASDPMRSL